MSLRTSYSGALDTKLAEARTSGRDSILVTNLASLTTSMTNAANKGQKVFSVNLDVSYQTADLIEEGPLWEAYRTGVLEALASQDIMNNEVVVSIDSDNELATTFIALDFSF